MEPSSWLLMKMVERAEAKFAADREQSLLQKRAHEEARAVRSAVAESKAKQSARNWSRS